MELEDLVRVGQTPADKKKQARRGKIVYLGHEKRSDWAAELPIYLFQCLNEDCLNHDRLAIDYPHGYEGSTKRLICPDCRTCRYFSIPIKFHLAQFWLLMKLAFQFKRKRGKTS